MRKLRHRLRMLRRDEVGSMAIELCIVVPIIVWALLSTYVYFDAYRVQANATRAGLTVADMFSREEAPVDIGYIQGARELLRTLTFEDSNPDLRVTVYRYRQAQDDYRVVWSRALGYPSQLNNGDLVNVRDQLPIMANNDRAILVETRTDYSAPFDTGIGVFTDTNLRDMTFGTFTVIRPRPSTLCFERNDGTLICGP